MLAALSLLSLLAAPAAAQTPIEGSAASSASDSSSAPVSDERQGGPFGLGVAIGAPSGVTGRLWFGDWSALQFTAGGNLGVPNSLSVSADYTIVFRPFKVTDNAYSVPLHIGGGVNVDVDLETGATRLLMGPRAVFGASLLVPDLPIDFHAELAPTVYFVEFLGWSIDGQIGVRYYF